MPTELHSDLIRELLLECHDHPGRVLRALLVGFDGATYRVASVDSTGALKVDATIVGGGGGLTDAELRASPVPVSGTVSVTEPVSVDDNGGSLTVDGPLTDVQLRAAPVPVSGTVSVTEPVSVDDNGASLTIDGTVAVSGVGGTVTIQEPLSIDDNGGSITVDGPLTDAELRATPVPVSGTISVSEPVSVDDNGGSLTVDNPQLSVVGGGAEATALRVTIANDSTGLLSVDDNGSTLSVDDGAGTLTVDNPIISVVGSGTEATAQRVTIATDSTGLLSVDDNGASLTIDNAQLSVVGGGTEAAALRVTIANNSTGLISVDDNGGSLTVDGTVTADTELPAAAALADGVANPTTTVIAAINHEYSNDDTTYDRARHSYSQTRTGLNTAAGAGTAVDLTNWPVSKFALQVKVSAGVVTAYNVVLEGSLDSTVWSTLVAGTSISGTDTVFWVGGGDKVAFYMRSNVNSVTGGGQVDVKIVACAR